MRVVSLVVSLPVAALWQICHTWFAERAAAERAEKKQRMIEAKAREKARLQGDLW